MVIALHLAGQTHCLAPPGVAGLAVSGGSIRYTPAARDEGLAATPVYCGCLPIQLPQQTRARGIKGGRVIAASPCK